MIPKAPRGWNPRYPFLCSVRRVPMPCGFKFLNTLQSAFSPTVPPCLTCSLGRSLASSSLPALRTPPPPSIPTGSQRSVSKDHLARLLCCFRSDHSPRHWRSPMGGTLPATPFSALLPTNLEPPVPPSFSWKVLPLGPCSCCSLFLECLILPRTAFQTPTHPTRPKLKGPVP